MSMKNIWAATFGLSLLATAAPTLAVDFSQYATWVSPPVLSDATLGTIPTMLGSNLPANGDWLDVLLLRGTEQDPADVGKKLGIAFVDFGGANYVDAAPALWSGFDYKSSLVPTYAIDLLGASAFDPSDVSGKLRAY